MVPLDMLAQQCRGGQSNTQGGHMQPKQSRGGAQAKLPRVWGRGGRLSHPQLVHQIQNPISKAPQDHGNTIVPNHLN